MEDGKQISGQFHRHVVVPGADYSGEDVKVQAIAAYEAAQEAAKVAQPE